MSRSLVPIRKIVASALSGLTATGLVGLLDGVGYHLDQTLAGAIVAVLAVAAGYLTRGDSTPPVK
jgi:hypothetical protein